MQENDQNPVGDENQIDPNPVGKSDEEQFVARKAYEEVSSDMHKFKSKLREAQARAAELEAKLKAEEEAKLKDQQQWQELYEREKAQRENIENQSRQERESYLRTVKLSALKAELGGGIKDEYLQFADIDSIDITEDGTLSSESVQFVANRFRKDHPTLVGKQSSVNITGNAAAGNVNYQVREKSVAEMTPQERMAALREIRERKFK